MTVRLVSAVPRTTLMFLPPMARPEPDTPTTNFWNPKSPSSEANPSTMRVRWPWITVTGLVPGPRSPKFMMMGPVGVWIEVGTPAG